MERRDFIKGVGGLAVIVSLSGIVGSLLLRDPSRSASVMFTTPDAVGIKQAIGPAMVAGIDLFHVDTKGAVRGYYGDTHIFNVDALGAELIMLADGSRTLEDINSQAERLTASALSSAGIAEFYVALGQAGYLQNKVLVTIYENQA